MFSIFITFVLVFVTLIGVYCWGYGRGFDVGKRFGELDTTDELTIDEGLGSVLRWVNSNDILPQDERMIETSELNDNNDAHDYIFVHECIGPGCQRLVEFDDEPWCFSCSPDEGSSLQGYSARRQAAVDEQIIDF